VFGKKKEMRAPVVGKVVKRYAGHARAWARTSQIGLGAYSLRTAPPPRHLAFLNTIAKTWRLFSQDSEQMMGDIVRREFRRLSLVPHRQSASGYATKDIEIKDEAGTTLLGFSASVFR